MRDNSQLLIAILGAGPIGLEAALYARRLGYAARVYERGHVGENLRQFGHVRLFSPLGMNASRLGIETLRRELAGWQPPAADALLTAREFVEQYVQPLANLPELKETICERVTVVAIGREGLLKGEHVGGALRAAQAFRLLVRGEDGKEWSERANVVLDATGTFGHANWLGSGGIPAEGETLAAAWIEHGLPDVLGSDRERYARKTTLVVGAGYSAATNVIALAELAEQASGTRVVWLTRAPHTSDPIARPIKRIENDRLPQRDRIACRANALAGGASSAVEYHASYSVTRVHREGDRVRVHAMREGREVVPGDVREFSVDRIIANCGFRPDNSLYRELQVHECYATGGPMKLATALLGQTSADCIDQVSPGSEALRTSEPSFFILGAKSYGRNSKFLLSIGLAQVRDVFQLITGNKDLDLYASEPPRD